MEKRKQTITVIEGKGLQNITDEKTNITSMVPGKVAISSRLAKEMGVAVGDEIYWHIYSKNDWYMSDVGLINRSPETAGITILREDFEKTGCEYVPSSIITNKNIMKYDDREGVAGVYDMEKIKKAFIINLKILNL